jgi:hypothetical protein
MALSRRALHAVGAILICAATAIYLLPPRRMAAGRPFNASGTQNLLVAADKARNEFEAAVDDWRLAIERDSLLPELRARADHPAAEPLVLVEESLPSGIHTTASPVLLRQWQRLAITEPKTRMAFAVVADTLSRLFGLDRQTTRGPNVFYLLPERAPASTDAFGSEGLPLCLTIIRIGRASNAARTIAGLVGYAPKPWFERSGYPLAGPCAFHAAFGAPGPRIGAWLTERRYDLAMDPDWSIATVRTGDLARSSRLGWPILTRHSRYQ